MQNLRDLQPTPHVSTCVFDKHKIPRSSVAQALGLSYPYVCNILSGIRRATPEVDSKLIELAATLEDQSPDKGLDAMEGGAGS